MKSASDLLAALAQKAGKPVSATFQVTDKCNYECVHCYQEHVGKANNDELSTEEVMSVLEQMAESGVLFLTLMGGEFFMRRDADEILQKAHDMGFAIRLFSTGHHIHEKRAEFIATLRPILVELSLYGAHKNTHEDVTHHPGSWQRTTDAAKRLIARGVSVLLKTPLMEQNAHELADLRAYAKEIGAEHTCDAKITAIENGDLTPTSLRMTETTMHRFYRDNGIADFLEKSYRGYDPAKPMRPDHHTPCRAGQQSFSINPRGEFWPCNAMPVPVGSIRSQTLAEIWYGSAELAEIRDLKWAKLSECNVCKVRDYCSRCHGMALSEHGTYAGPSLEACRHAVASRDMLREKGVIPATETALPPTWDRIEKDGQHERLAAKRSPTSRSVFLRVVG